MAVPHSAKPYSLGMCASNVHHEFGFHNPFAIFFRRKIKFGTFHLLDTPENAHFSSVVQVHRPRT